MNRRQLEKLKIPESVRVPILGGKIYQYLVRKENDLIQTESIHKSALNSEKRTEKVIASMTSFPARIEYVHIALKSLMTQSYKPDRIVLWLAEEQFPEHHLPQQLLTLQDYGLESNWCADV